MFHNINMTQIKVCKTVKYWFSLFSLFGVFGASPLTTSFIWQFTIIRNKVTKSRSASYLIKDWSQKCFKNLHYHIDQMYQTRSYKVNELTSLPQIVSQEIPWVARLFTYIKPYLQKIKVKSNLSLNWACPSSAPACLHLRFFEKLFTLFFRTKIFSSERKLKA